MAVNIYLDEGMDGPALKDLFEMDFNGLNLGLLGLERFKEQLQFKKCLTELFKKPYLLTPQKQLLSPIQTRNLLTKYVTYLVWF